MQLLFSLFLRMLSNARGSLSYPYLIGYEIPWFCTTSTVDRVVEIPWFYTTELNPRTIQDPP